MGYQKDIVKGISWIGLLKILTKTIGFIEILILAKLLVPSEFGAYAIALLALGLLETLTETGVNIILMQEKSIEEYLDSAWIVSILRGIIISILLFLSAPLIANFFNAPNALNLLYLICLVPLLRGFINPAIIKYQKELKFGKNFLYQSAILLFDTVISITLTFILKSPIGIILGLISGVALELIISYLFVKPIPRFKFKKSYVGVILNRGKWITLSSVFNYLFYNADNIAVGRMLGTASLGVYQLAYSVAVMPIDEIGKVFAHVSVPVLVKIGNDKKRLKSALIKLIVGTFILSAPLALILIAFPSILVILLGQKWSLTLTILPTLAVLGLIRSMMNTSSSVFLSHKKQNYTTIITFINIVSFLLIIVPLITKFSLLGAGLAGLISVFISLPFIIYFVKRTLDQINYSY